MQHADTYQLKDKKQAARFLNISDFGIERLMRDKQNGLKYVKVRGLVRFRPEDLVDYVNRNTRGGMAA